MVYLQVPFDLIQTTIMLPNPKLGDTTNNQIDMQARNSMNGTLYTYVKTSDRIKKVWDFRLTREKSIELETFLDYYNQLEFRVVDWNDKEYRMWLTNYPVSFERQFMNNETNVRLEFEGTEL